MNDKLVSIDANVILRFLLDDHAELSSKASEILAGVQTGLVSVVCDPVNLAEVAWILSTFYHFDNREISEALEPIIQLEGFLLPNKDRYLLALKLFAGPAHHFGDACACAAALEKCEGRLYSFDAELSNVEGLDRRESVRE